MLTCHLPSTGSQRRPPHLGRLGCRSYSSVMIVRGAQARKNSTFFSGSVVRGLCHSTSVLGTPRRLA